MMKNQMIEYLNSRRKELGYSYKELSEKCGLPLSTVQKIFGGYVYAPRRETLEKLEKYLLPEERTINDMDGAAKMLRDAPAGAALSLSDDDSRDYDEKQGHHTLEEYLALPEGTRVELIDGVFYDMAAPHSVHQTIVAELLICLHSFIRRNKGACIPFISPIDVQPDENKSDVFQPDVLVVCDKKKIHSRIIGAPDLVIEILSPSNTRKLMSKKLMKYRQSGVREYWEVDPEQEIIQVYLFDPSGKADTYFYTFDDKVPVAIWDGKCRIDFGEIKSVLKSLSEEIEL